MNLYTKTFIIFTLIATLEVLHGILRARFLAPRVGDLKSRQIAVFTGCTIIYLVAWHSMDWIAPESVFDSFKIGFIWFLSMITFEFLLGHYVFGFSWRWLMSDFNIFKGRLLAIGMIFLWMAPYIVCRFKAKF